MTKPPKKFLGYHAYSSDEVCHWADAARIIGDLDARIAELEAERDNLERLNERNVRQADEGFVRAQRLESQSECHEHNHEAALGLLEEARKRIAELEAERRWVPVEKRLPPADTEVLLWFRDADTRPTTPSHEALGYWIDIGEDYPMWVAPYPWDTQKPVFWMPKPKPPEATDAD